MILSLEVDNIDVVGVMGTLTWRARERVTVDGGLTTGRQDNRYQRLRWSV
ncbi:hypothetical protein SOM61_20150 [Massilia sp. CFBP9012]|nr:hypothetical protein [Massilia sp. CFBP9012]MDY0977276.1 hypothetical protein [Massilia sp. CFBP9012]